MGFILSIQVADSFLLTSESGAHYIYRATLNFFPVAGGGKLKMGECRAFGDLESMLQLLGNLARFHPGTPSPLAGEGRGEGAGEAKCPDF